MSSSASPVRCATIAIVLVGSAIVLAGEGPALWDAFRSASPPKSSEGLRSSDGIGWRSVRVELAIGRRTEGGPSGDPAATASGSRPEGVELLQLTRHPHGGGRFLNDRGYGGCCRCVAA